MMTPKDARDLGIETLQDALDLIENTVVSYEAKIEDLEAKIEDLEAKIVSLEEEATEESRNRQLFDEGSIPSLAASLELRGVPLEWPANGLENHRDVKSVRGSTPPPSAIERE